MIVYISQPMSGRPEKDIIAERQEAIKRIVEKYGHDAVVLNTYYNDNYRRGVEKDLKINKHKGLFWLSQTLEFLASADVIWVCDGWKCARGCLIELLCAKTYGIQVEFDAEYRKES